MNKSLIAIALLLTSCSATQPGWFQYQPVVDTQGVNYDRYLADLGQCYAFADQIDVLGDFVLNVGQAALVGAAGGAAIGAIGGSAATGAALGAGIGGLVGEGNIDARRRQELVINRCLIGRGYKFLG